MKKLLVFGASSHSKSINKQLAVSVAQMLDNVELNIIDMRDYEMPLYSVDKEGTIGMPEQAVKFKKQLAEADGVIISFAEHNGTYTAVFKNLYDWASRVEKNMWLDKPYLLLATSPGARGGITCLESAVERFGYMNANVIGSLSVPRFNEVFDAEKGLIDEELKSNLKGLTQQLAEAM